MRIWYKQLEVSHHDSQDWGSCVIRLVFSDVTASCYVIVMTSPSLNVTITVAMRYVINTVLTTIDVTCYMYMYVYIHRHGLWLLNILVNQTRCYLISMYAWMPGCFD